ncbi:haloacid dehalogenase type II [Halalkalicoccus jeotgali]|uniref:Haloacid dehalogenase, type II n=1 Tax=Halalkalicoccus jeotgali (strain DSM 18796 / CECT 7217 / JCM 14584 / KCTC 4019 / B3) TaxID=795797 RepID=D8J7Y3_HALJB|nr:haloacid dehalogenase type II [Halalkalicoccus jeotgali]ADJ14096.1 haloacid dehalogenase, type II [Halalkalicoccus jeotgali B3]ELY34474.1 haloacid dehalogenase, type II [Halalkalicoccus jeotgali B3]
MTTIATETIREETRVLAFDLWDTLLDRESTLVPALGELLTAHGSEYDPEILLRRYLAMHFRDSMIDSLIPGPHTPFKEISRRALAYRLDQIGLDVPDEAVREVIRRWKELRPYPDVDDALARLGEEYQLVGLSNGDPDMLEAVRPNFESELDGVVSVAEAGAYKPHRASYDRCCERFDVAPHEVLFVTSHTFDLVGAKAIGMRGAFLNRHENPYGGWIHRPDLVVEDAGALADALC